MKKTSAVGALTAVLFLLPMLAYADLIVSGFGNSAVNGTYVEGAQINSFLSYFNGSKYICHYNTSHAWKINSSTACNNGEGDNLYYTDDAVATPDLVTTWIDNGGGTPIGTITYSAPVTPALGGATSTLDQAQDNFNNAVWLFLVGFIGMIWIIRKH